MAVIDTIDTVAVSEAADPDLASVSAAGVPVMVRGDGRPRHGVRHNHKALTGPHQHQFTTTSP
ncbi:hypothetical protein AQI84_29475 [Streptomyces griseorubiginosus]|nr:hypothetical protein AQI84_29475 [Streptomyces griseorubiginosus]